MAAPRRLVVDLGANLVWPFVILTWASGVGQLGPQWGPAVAMVGPLAHVGWRRLAEGKASPMGGFVALSIGLNAAAGFLPLDAAWFAAKEAVFGVGIGIVFAATALRGPGLVGGLLDEVAERTKVEAALGDRAPGYWRAVRRGTLAFGGLLAASGLVSGALAAVLVRSPTGSAGFAEELGRYTAWSYGIVNLPLLVGSMWVLRGVLVALETSTGRRIEELAR